MDKLGPEGISMLKRFLADLHTQRADLQRLVTENNFQIKLNNIDVTQSTINKLEALITEYSMILESAQ